LNKAETRLAARGQSRLHRLWAGAKLLPSASA
jgi:hypothetical protein